MIQTVGRVCFKTAAQRGQEITAITFREEWPREDGSRLNKLGALLVRQLRAPFLFLAIHVCFHL